MQMNKSSLIFCLLVSLMAFGERIANLAFDNLELYPSYAPYAEEFLQVSPLHKISYAEFGNPEGMPVIVLHGGPGAGCSPSWSSFFDPSFYRVIMFDQRGAGRSIPSAEMEDNTSQKSVEDIEALRTHLGIDRWLVFGGSWGSTLAILYGETHPDRVLGFVLRGVFLGRPEGYKHLFYGMKNTFPEAWDEMVTVIPVEERDDLITAFYKRVIDPNPEIHLPAARAFVRYDTICGTLLPNLELVEKTVHDDQLVLSLGRTFIHYCANQFFFSQNQLIQHLDKIKHIPCVIVQGRYDIICPPKDAYELYQGMDDADLWLIANGGHFSSEPPIARGLRLALDKMKTQLRVQ